MPNLAAASGLCPVAARRHAGDRYSRRAVGKHPHDSLTALAFVHKWELVHVVCFRAGPSGSGDVV